MTVTGIDWFRDGQALQIIDLTSSYMGAACLITRRSQVQILSPQPINQRACSDAGPFDLARVSSGLAVRSGAHRTRDVLPVVLARLPRALPRDHRLRRVRSTRRFPLRLSGGVC